MKLAQNLFYSSAIIYAIALALQVIIEPKSVVTAMFIALILLHVTAGRLVGKESRRL